MGRQGKLAKLHPVVEFLAVVFGIVPPKKPLTAGDVFLLQEIPIVLFFVYFFNLCYLYHSKNPTMADFHVTFDNLWFFYHQLREGVFPQWNPYSLLGRIATNWNAVPVSIFTPFLLFAEFSLSAYKIISVIGTFATFFSLYVVCRILKYNRYISLVPFLVFLWPGRFSSITAMIIFSATLPLVHIAFGVFWCYLIQRGELSFRQWLALSLLLAISFLNMRFENMIHTLVFLGIAYAVFGVSRLPDMKKMIRVFTYGAGTAAVILLVNAWQLSILLNVVLNSFRISIHLDFHRLIDPLFYKWIVKSLVYQAPLLLACTNILLFYVLKLLNRKRQTVFLRLPIPVLIVIAALEYIVMVFMYRTQIIGFNYTWLGAITDTAVLARVTEMQFYAFFCVAAVIAATIYLVKRNSVKSEKYLLVLSALLAGSYIAQIMNTFWVSVYPQLPFWSSVILFVFLSIGSYSFAFIRRKAWLVIIPVIYIFIGESGVFILNDIVGIPWFSVRANPILIPLVVIIIAEGISFTVRGLSLLLCRLIRKANRTLVRSCVLIATGTCCFLFATLSIRPLFLPVSPAGVYAGIWPYSSTPIPEVMRNAASPATYAGYELYELYTNTLRIREQQKDSWKRYSFPTSFLPSFSERLNVRYLYNNDIPQELGRMFNSSYNSDLTVHVEHMFQQCYSQYKKEECERSGKEVNKDYTGSATLSIDISNTLHSQLLAMSYAPTQRVFLSGRIMQFDTWEDERAYLVSNAQNENFLLQDVSTTSDMRFKNTMTNLSNQKLQYSIQFQKDSPENIVLTVTTDREAVLALLDLFDTGWHAFVDGHETPVYKIYVGTRGVIVPAGTHTVVFKYRIPWFYESCWLSIVAAFSLALFLISGVFMKKYGANNRINKLSD